MSLEENWLRKKVKRMDKVTSVKVTNSFEQDARYLTMIFVTLKLCGVISWSWLWVISPIPLLFAFGFIMGIVTGTSRRNN